MDPARTFGDLTRGLAVGGTLLLVTDYDGSLTPFVPDPARARLPSDVRRDLRLLSRSTAVRVAVMSGRALDDVRRRVGVGGLIYAGCHGLEVAGGGLRFVHPAAHAERASLSTVAESLVSCSVAIPGTLVEAKGLAVAVHYRHVAVDDIPLVEWEVSQAVNEAARRQPGARLQILRGNRVLEVLPEVGWYKGECALWIRRQILSAAPPPVMLLYLGDEGTDERAFRALADEAVTVRVGAVRARTAATYRLADLHVVLRLLSALAEEFGPEARR
jgi:trehalose 6-phosphate phosphatase